jgi:hypothetical protein
LNTEKNRIRVLITTGILFHLVSAFAQKAGFNFNDRFFLALIVLSGALIPILYAGWLYSKMIYISNYKLSLFIQFLVKFAIFSTLCGVIIAVIKKMRT